MDRGERPGAMTGRCEEFDRLLGTTPGDGDVEARWQEHLAGCASCREQAAADTLLREALPTLGDVSAPAVAWAFADDGVREVTYYTLKDGFAILVFLIVFAAFMFYSPDYTK